MAALGAPSYGCWIDWILKELVRLEDSQALPAFRHWAKGIDAQTK
jgi:hypothetical protein